MIRKLSQLCNSFFELLKYSTSSYIWLQIQILNVFDSLVNCMVASLNYWQLKCDKSLQNILVGSPAAIFIATFRWLQILFCPSFLSSIKLWCLINARVHWFAPHNSAYVRLAWWVLLYRIVASTSPSRIEAHAGFFRSLMKGIFDPYVLWPFDKKLIF